MNGWDKAVTFPLNSPRKAHLCPLNGWFKWSAMSNLTAMMFGFTCWHTQEDYHYLLYDIAIC
jgi:hypothetical protein